MTSSDQRALILRVAGKRETVAVQDFALGTVAGYVEYADDSGYAIGGRYLLWTNLEIVRAG